MISIQVRKPFLTKVAKKVHLVSMETVLSALFPGSLFDLGVLICSDEEIRKLNSSYRGVDRATDVLSFGSEETDPESGRRYLGDLIVSYETAEAQARAAKHDVTTEINILLIHGLLHLLGYDHDTEAKKQKMWKKQYRAHQVLGIHVTTLSGENDQPA